ncbi:MAG: chorismate synthase [Clostridia bacterium]|nr:chorismate synthase [Clostridia bacterium]
MSCSFGKKFRLTVFGQSHSKAIGAVIDGIPAGVRLDEEKIKALLSRRAPGKNAYSTKRREADEYEILSGTVDGMTCGAPLCAVIYNTDARSGDYEKLKTLPRPSHSDYAAYIKHHGFNDVRGGGNFSGRMTAPLCFAGAVAMQILESRGIYIGAHIKSIAGIEDRAFSPVDVSAAELENVKKKDFPVLDDEAGERMKAEIEKARAELDSVGGVIECAVTGLPAGIGEPMFDGVENVVSRAVFAVPAVKGIEFGLGFASSELRGSENNDPFTVSDGRVLTETNNSGGILGGITSGMPVIFRAAVKPTPSVGIEQGTVNLETNSPARLVTGGRHDPCIVPRAVPCIEAAAALAIINLM